MEAAAVDHSDQLPAGVSPAVLWFWRGITRNNLGGWHTDAQGRNCASGDTSMWFQSPGNKAGGPDVYSCVQDRYPQLVDDCTTVLLKVATPPAPFPASVAGCYSTKANVTITF